MKKILTVAGISILIISLVIIAVLPVSPPTHHNRPPPKEVIDHLANNHKNLQNDNISFNVTLTNKTPSMSIYDIEVQNYTKANCLKLINSTYPSWMNDNVSVKYSKIIQNSTIYIKENETISVFENGAIEYFNRSAIERWISNKSNQAVINLIKSKNEAYNISVEYIKNHGGFPKDYFLFHTDIAYNVHNDTSSVEAYCFHFQRKIDGYTITGKSGEGVWVYMTPLGDIITYHSMWTEINQINKTINVKSSKDASDCLKEHFNGNFNVEDVQLGYYFSNKTISPTNLVPVWIFYTDINNTQYYLIDAIDLNYWV